MHGRAELVLYDADCGICSRLAAWLGRRGIRVSPIRSAVGEVELRDLARAQRDATVHVVDDCGRRRSGAEALPPILRSVPRLAWSARLVEAAPAPFRLGYTLVARHRGRLSRLAGGGCEIR
ncbi:MAG TPA: DCC1-like thiol-disulfide oxidoreductase family protein [Gaiella sp.]|jgi:predicted DCC family thiol-disulfide oxidoreductase YuxK|nr:DCC1-like thiol-disulfide oxidoreductase family protein [Gaiella sp.]